MKPTNYGKKRKSESDYEKGYKVGYTKGYTDGYEDGEKAGVKDAVKAFAYMNGEYGEGKVNNDGSTDAKDKNSD